MTRYRDLSWVPIRNEHAQDVPAYGVCKITGTEVRGGRTVYVVSRPDSSLKQVYLVNGPQILPPGADIIGSGTFDVTYALADSAASPLLGEHWGVQVDSWKLKQHRAGFYMLGNYQGTGATQRALVQPYVLQQLRGVLDAGMSQGGSATVSVYFRDGAAWTDSTMNVTAYDDLLRASPAGSLDAGAIVILRWYGDRWWVQEARCADA